MGNPNPRQRGSLWWLAPATKTYFELRTHITPHYATEANDALPPETEPYLWLPPGQKPHPTARAWASY